MIEITAAPPFLTVQDQGRPTYRAQGVPSGGAIDTWALTVANAIVGNAADAAALEWSLGSGRIRWHDAGAFALAGASVDATLDGAPIAMHRCYRAREGSVLAVQRFAAGRFAYLACAGGIDTVPVLSSRATYLSARFGGLEGRLLRAGDRLDVGVAAAPYRAAGFTVPRELEPRYDAEECRVVAGPHAALFSADAWSALTATTYAIDGASDRMGYRLVGPALQHQGDAALPSAPVCPGAVQVPAGGRPIVLMADAPTVGGYPVIAVVCTADLPVVAQRTPGEAIRFRVVSVEDAQRALRRRAVAVHTISQLVLGVADRG
jgi:antagonist of KipI